MRNGLILIIPFLAAAALANPHEVELQVMLPEIFARSAAHYRAIDAAATPRMNSGKSKRPHGERLVPHGWDARNGRLVMNSIYGWTAGYYPGSLWFLYEATGDEFFKERAIVWTEMIAPNSKVTDCHDVGLIMSCSFGNARRVLKTEKYDALLIETADSLSKRYSPDLGLIRSWGSISDKREFLVIPDNLVVLESLEIAAKLRGGERRFDEIARSHATTTMAHHFRADGGTYHVLNYDQRPGFLGKVQEVRRGQGLSCETAWSRGQSWAIYGYTMMYRETKYPAYLAFAQKLADFAIDNPNMPADGVPYWDYGAPGEERDTSAASIMASGLLELSSFLSAEEGPRYRAFAVKQLLSLCSGDYYAKQGENGDWLLKHGVGHKPAGGEIDTPLDYGDYYFLEALLRFSRMSGVSGGECIRTAGAEDRALWVKSMIRIAAPVITNLEAGTLRANFPKRRGHGIPQFSELEAFGRVMTGFAPWFELPDDDTPEGRLRAAWRPRLLKAIRNAVDPKSPDFMIFAAKDPKRARQPLVDAAFFAQGLLRSRKGVWEHLDETTKKMTIDALVSSRATEPHASNWLLFAGEIEAFLLEVTGKCDMERLRLGVDKFAHEWYVGEGYYSDGAAMAFDGYNSFVIHPMFYEIVEVMARHGIKDGDKYLALEKKRLYRFADLQERMISPEGAYPMIGRSICYRFGTLQGLGLAATLGRKYHPASDGAIRSAMTAVLRRQTADRNFRPDGWLTVGFNGEQHCLAEGYIGYGSVYLCTSFFLPLTLPPDSAFWTAPAEPWTSKAGWAGEKVRIDHMFR